MDTSGIGRRIAYCRDRRRMTQADFGALMGKSRRWVQDIEGGLRQTDPRLSVLERAAQVLGVNLETLLADAPRAAECVDTAELAAIRATVQHHDVITGTCTSATGEPPPLAELGRGVRYGWTAFQASNYSPLGTALPGLIAGANHAACQYTGDDQRAALRLLSLALQLTEAIATKYDDEHLAFQAASRSVTAAERSGDPVVMAAALRHLADAMYQRGDGQAAVNLSIASAARLEADLIKRGAPGLSVLGMLYLKAAMASAHNEDPAAVPGLLDQASDTADRLGHDRNEFWSAFGPTNVSLYRVATLVRLSEGGEAVEASAEVTPAARDALPRERRAHYRVDTARALIQAGRRVEAVDKLLEAEREAPEEVHCRPHSKKLVEDLTLLGAESAESRLRALARRCGLWE
ncbi:helix-turn-helix domain-containing protein [Streptomyces sp. NPDC054933]